MEESGRENRSTGDPRSVEALLERIAELESRLERQDARAGSVDPSELQSSPAVVPTARFGMWVWDPSRDELFWSLDLYRILGVPTSETATLTRFMESVLPEDRPMMQERMEAARTSVDPKPTDFRVRRPDGVVITVTGGGVPVPGPDAPDRMMGVVIDVSEQRALQAQLQTTQKREAVGRLAAGLAHDVNNALGVIMGHASLMRENYASPSLDAILQATRAAASTTHQLLAYGRQTVLRPTLLDLSDLVLESRHLFERVLEANVQFDVVVDRTCGCVRLDRGQVQQVLLNLILNARDAMPEGGRIEVEVLPAETERGPWVVLEVRDQGAGMDETVQARIFDPFFTTKGPGAGSGLGLAMVAGIVSQSGGEVRVESRPGAGSTFRLLFPVASTEPADAIAKQLPADRPAGPLRIVLVDDDEGVSDLLERVLRSAGHEVKTFRHPERALVDCVAGQRWDVLVTDAVMPGMDGPTLADALRLRFPGLRVLFISGYAPARWGDRFSGKGSGFLGKPFGPKELLAAVEALVADTSSGAGA